MPSQGKLPLLRRHRSCIICQASAALAQYCTLQAASALDMTTKTTAPALFYSFLYWFLLLVTALSCCFCRFRSTLSAWHGGSCSRQADMKRSFAGRVICPSRGRIVPCPPRIQRCCFDSPSWWHLGLSWPSCAAAVEPAAVLSDKQF